MKQTIQETVASVQNAPSSIFTKEDVLTLLNNLQAADSITKFDQQMITDLCEVICDQIRDNARNLSTEDVVDTGSAEFELYGNEIQLSSVDIDDRSIAEAVVDGVADAIEEFFEKLVDEVEEEDEEEADNQ